MSQILHAGGVPMYLYGVHHGGWPTWWQDAAKRDNSNSWSVAATFVHNFLKFHYAANVDGQPFQPGDMVGWSWNDGNIVDHVNFVYQVVNGVPYFLQHSNDYSTPKPLYPDFQASATQAHEWPARMWHLRFYHRLPTSP
jgi:hypothetical protein